MGLPRWHKGRRSSGNHAVREEDDDESGFCWGVFSAGDGRFVYEIYDLELYERPTFCEEKKTVMRWRQAYTGLSGLPCFGCKKSFPRRYSVTNNAVPEPLSNKEQH